MKALKISVYVYNILFAIVIAATHFVSLIVKFGSASLPIVQLLATPYLYLLIFELFLLGPLVFAAAALIGVVLLIGSDFLGAMKTRDTVINLAIFGSAVLTYIIRIAVLYCPIWFS